MMALVAPSASPWKPMSQVVNRITRLEKGRRKARLVAQEYGHRLGDWQNDTGNSSISSCLVCENFAAVDAAHGQAVELVGQCLDRACPGDPIR